MCIAVLGVTKQGLQGDLGTGKGNERSSHVDGWGISILVRVILGTKTPRAIPTVGPGQKRRKIRGGR